MSNGITRAEVQDGKQYTITLSDCYGEYKSKVTAKFYKPGSHKDQLKAAFRFIDEYNRVIPARYAEKIKEMEMMG